MTTLLQGQPIETTTLPQEEQPINPSDALSNVLCIWLHAVPEGPIRSRDLLNLAIEEIPPLLRAFNAVIPGFAAHPHPPRLVTWLKQIENLPVNVGGQYYRITREGHRWKLSKINLTLTLFKSVTT